MRFLLLLFILSTPVLADFSDQDKAVAKKLEVIAAKSRGTNYVDKKYVYDKSYGPGWLYLAKHSEDPKVVAIHSLTKDMGRSSFTYDSPDTGSRTAKSDIAAEAKRAKAWYKQKQHRLK